MDSTVTAVPVLAPLAIVLALFCIVALIRPMPSIGLRRRRTILVLLAASLIGLFLSLMAHPA